MLQAPIPHVERSAGELTEILEEEVWTDEAAGYTCALRSDRVMRMERANPGAMSGPLPSSIADHAIAEVKADLTALGRAASERPLAPKATPPPSLPVVSALRPRPHEGVGLAAAGAPAQVQGARQPHKAASFFASYGKKGSKGRGADLLSEVRNSIFNMPAMEQELVAVGIESKVGYMPALGSHKYMMTTHTRRILCVSRRAKEER